MRGLIRYRKALEYLIHVRKNLTLGKINTEECQLTSIPIRTEKSAISVGNDYACWKNPLGISRRKRSFKVTYYGCVCRDGFALSNIY